MTAVITPPVEKIGECPVCGAPFMRNHGRGRPRRYCSDDCRRRAEFARRRLAPREHVEENLTGSNVSIVAAPLVRRLATDAWMLSIKFFAPVAGQDPPGLVTGKWSKDSERERRAMSGASSGAGGALLPSVMLGQVVDLARNQTQVVRAGARIVPLSNRNVIMPKWVTDPTVAWRNENAAITNANGAVDKISFAAQVLAGSTTLLREIIEDTDLSGLLENAFAKAVALAWDQAALLGSGVAPEPVGVKNSAAVTDKAALGTNGVAFVWSHLIDTAASLRAATRPPAPRSWRPGPWHRSVRSSAPMVTTSRSRVTWPTWPCTRPASFR